VSQVPLLIDIILDKLSEIIACYVSDWTVCFSVGVLPFWLLWWCLNPSFTS